MFAHLYDEALTLTKNALTPPPLEEHPTKLLCTRVAPIQHQLCEQLLQAFPECVRAAAREGRSSCDILTFGGNEKFVDDFSYLFLLKGPRDREQKYDLYLHGFAPVFNKLVFELAPFTLQYIWIPGANVNKLTVSWPGVPGVPSSC